MKTLIVALLCTTSIPAYAFVCDNVTDDYQAISDELRNNPGKVIHLPEGRICRLSQGIVMQGGTIYSEGSPLQNPPWMGSRGGASLRCDEGVQTCLTMTGGDATSGAPMLRGIAVIGSGTPKPGQIGILVKDTYNAQLNNVSVYNQAQAIYQKATGPLGISSKLDNVETCRTTESDLVIDSWPETRVHMVRFGCNGDTIVRKDGYITVTGGGPGPNTLTVTNSHFNAGAGGARCFINFTKFTYDQYSGIISEFNISSSHFEAGYNGGLNESGICSDETVYIIQRLNLTGNWFLNTGNNNKFLNLHPNTSIWNWSISSHFISWAGGFSVNSLYPTYNLTINNSQFQNTPFSINGVWPSVMQANSLFEGVSLSGNFYKAKIDGVNNGPLTNTATGITVGF